MINVYRWFACLSVLVLTGCPAQTQTSPAASTPPPNSKQALILIGTSQSPIERLTYLSAQPVTGFPESADRDAMYNQCGIPPNTQLSQQQRQAVLPLLALAAAAVNTVFDYAFTWASDKLQEALGEYTKGFQAVSTDYFYKTGTGNITFANLSNNIQCIRFYRADVDPETRNQTIAFDFVAQVRISPDRQSFQVRPLGLYFQRPLAKTGGSISIAVEIIGNGVWVDKTRGEKAQIFDETILKGEKYTDQQLVSQPIRYFKKLPIDTLLSG